ncbi:hypothetical protein AVEN_14313-1, partial [Araneus ventricosus]
MGWGRVIDKWIPQHGVDLHISSYLTKNMVGLNTLEPLNSCLGTAKGDFPDLPEPHSG